MFVDKPKRKDNVFQGELLEGEEILWMGQSDKWRIFTKRDCFLIPGYIFFLFVPIFFWDGLAKSQPLFAYFFLL